VNRWMAAVVITCAAAVAVAQWFVPPVMQAVLGVLLLALVALTVISLQATVRSVEAAHRELMDGEQRYRAIFTACSDAIFVWSLQDDGRPGLLEEVNQAACWSLGYPRDRLLQLSIDEIHAPELRADLQKHWRDLRNSGSVVFETAHRTSSGHVLFVEVSARVVEIRGRRLCLAVARNVAARKEQEERWRGLSNHDDLTGLLNRRGFFTMVEEVERRARRLGVQILLMYVDVDGLKRVNDELGHAAGDLLIVAAANVLRITFREGDVLARLGGDEFVALAVLGESCDELLDRQTIKARFQSAVEAKRAELGEEYAFSLSCGSTVITSAALGQIDELLTRADERMYEAKRLQRRSRAS
jgi:diguanylate cyclase (GGDEF)-like protein/PAS domain S-box-containing protein